MNESAKFDAFGVELQVGDTVYTTDVNSTKINKAVVLAFTSKKVRVLETISYRYTDASMGIPIISSHTREVVKSPSSFVKYN